MEAGVAVSDETGIAPERASRVAVVAEDGRARTRMLAILRGPEAMVRAVASADRLMDEGVQYDLLVFHCETVKSAELDLFRRLKQESDALVVAVCESTNTKSARRALDTGVDGFVFGDDVDAALSVTVAAVLAGQTVAPRSLRTTVRKPSLSFREKQILGLVVMGYTNSEIGSRLFLAESTIKSHLSSAFTKLGVRSRNEAAAAILDPQGSLGTGILAITDRNWSAPA